LRYANIYGPRQIPKGEAGVVAIFTENLLSGKTSVLYHFPDEPDGMERDYCYVEDVVKANILVLKNGSNEIFNIGSGKPTRTRELYKILYDLINNSNSLLRAPIPAPPRHGDIKRSCLNIDKAKRILGWAPDVSLEEGLKKTVQWYSTHNKNHILLKNPRQVLFFYTVSTSGVGTVIFTCPFIKLSNKHTLSLPDFQWSNRGSIY